MSEDPIGFKGHDFNIYRYVSNNPVREIDPSGESVVLGAACEIAAGIDGLGTWIELSILSSQIDNYNEQIKVQDNIVNDPKACIEARTAALEMRTLIQKLKIKALKDKAKSESDFGSRAMMTQLLCTALASVPSI